MYFHGDIETVKVYETRPIETQWAALWERSPNSNAGSAYFYYIPEEKIEPAKDFDAKAVEKKWYAFWEENAFFQADPNSPKPAFTLNFPSPNVTGALHMGHALNITLHDILIRWKRMSGYEALWIPTTDDGGIATQTAVERHLIKQTGKTRKEFSKEEFLQHVYEWIEPNKQRILDQCKCLGSSCDWKRLCFSMDEGHTIAVKTFFKMLFDDGLIYRGDYLVNWDPVTQTVLANDEVEYENRQSYLWYFKYPLKEEKGFVHIATMRPETMLGDSAIAVSPQDARFKHLIGKTVILPLMNREIPIISDQRIDPKFGTGMIKISPAHDSKDYQIGIAHKLPLINIMTPDGKINENGGLFQGMTMQDASHVIVGKMEELGFLEKIEPYNHRVGISYRSKAIIEPYLSKQWFIKMEGFKKPLRDAVQEGRLELIPNNWTKKYFHWVDRMHDWCISRQLWYGHRIPIWYNKEDPSKIICYIGEGEPEEVRAAPGSWMQDEDVLDTWFSSGVLTFSPFGWPKETPELKKFYSHSSVITGHDILFLSVARETFMSEYALGKIPFSKSLLHGLIYGKSYWRLGKDGGIDYISGEEKLAYDLGKPLPDDVKFKWEKMSKTKGNVIDPMEIIDQYGTDAMRMALCTSTIQARKIDLDRQRFEDSKNIINKIWSGAHSVFKSLDGVDSLAPEELAKGLDESLLTPEDRWILSILNKTVNEVNDKLENYTFDQAALQAIDFFQNEFCSHYLEIAKPVLFGNAGKPGEKTNKQKLQVIILCQALRLIHPVAPFITEELFQMLKKRFEGVKIESPDYDPYTAETIKALNAKACMIADYPQGLFIISPR